jgi:hypothetical protein
VSGATWHIEKRYTIIASGLDLHQSRALIENQKKRDRHNGWSLQSIECLAFGNNRRWGLTLADVQRLANSLRQSSI